jgi:hypothetical protein
MSFQAESCTGGRVCGVSAPRMPWSGPAVRPFRAVRSKEERIELKCRIELWLLQIKKGTPSGGIKRYMSGSLSGGHIRTRVEAFLMHNTDNSP